MSPERWQRVQELFHRALELPEPERQAFLVAECADDRDLLEEVSALLAQDARGGSLLEKGQAYVAQRILDAAPSFQTIGPYRVLKELDRGGMGIVYLAEHLGRRVAVKVLRDASLSPARRERFEREQEFLAQLTHPAIARLYDADTLPDGTPYFVMEYIEGVRITEFCSANSCDAPQTLALFREVCEAVQYAHRQAVIHRDLKPSNILATPHWKVSLLDFGIAKQMVDLERPNYTQTAQQMMTPAYAAPEQLRAEPLGVYTDIYALGLILYELLAGAPCFDLHNCTPVEVMRLILQEEPEKPSLRAARNPNAPLRRLNRTQRADLDLICLKAMHKDPQRRYASVESLIRDLDHYRNNEPLEARPDDLGYRLGKFVRRHGGAVAGTGVALAVILSLATFYTARLAQERTLAREEAAKAEGVRDYLISIFEASDPLGDGANVPDVRTLLQRGVESAENLASQPQLQSQIFDVTGRVYTMLSDYPLAEKLLKRALAIREKNPDRPLDIAESLTNLGVLYRYDSRYEEAEKLTRESLAIRERELPAMDPDIATTLDNLGVILSNSGEYARADDALKRALEIRRKSLPQPNKLVDHTLNNLAVNEFNQGNYDAAEGHYREALAVSMATYGALHPLTAVDMANLGVLLDTRGDFDAADKVMTEALRVTEQRLTENHYETAFRMSQLGGMLRRKGDYDRAEAYLRKALEIEGRVLEPNHRNTGVTMSHLALTLLEKKQYAEAEQLLIRSREIFRQSVGAQHPFTATVTCSLAYALHLQGKNAEAESLFREGLDTLRASLPPDHDMIALNESRYAVLLTATSHFEEAERLLTRSYEILRKTFGERHRDTLETAGRLAALFTAWGKPEQAAVYKKVVATAP